MRLKLTFCIAAAALVVLASTVNPPIKRTGAPADGGLDCAQCHGAGSNTFPGGSVSIIGLQPYNPGAAQNLQIRIQDPAASQWGFQLTSRFINGNGTLKAGSFAAVDASTKVVCDDGSPSGSASPCASTQQEFIEHNGAPHTSTGVGATFQFQWQPPSDENGDVTFYLSAVAGDSSRIGSDHVYTISVRVPLSESAACSLTRRPSVRTAVNAGPHAGPISPNAMVEIYSQSNDFQPGSRFRQIGPGDLGSGKFPTVLSCIGVEINGQRVPITYVQQDQINVQAPTNLPAGPVTVTVIGNPDRGNALRSDVATITGQAVTPAFFTFGTTKSIAAQFAGTANIVADPAVVPGAKPAKAGDLVTLYGSGFGFTDPVWQQGEISSGLSRLTGRVTVKIGDITLAPADVTYSGLAPQSISGLYQFNVKIPAGTGNGDIPVTITVDGVPTQTGATIPVQN